MTETRGTHVAAILQRAQRRIQAMLADANQTGTPGLRERLTEERDTLSRIAVAIRGLTADHLVALRTPLEEHTIQDGDREAKIYAVIEAILGDADA